MRIILKKSIILLIFFIIYTDITCSMEMPTALLEKKSPWQRLEERNQQTLNEAIQKDDIKTLVAMLHTYLMSPDVDNSHLFVQQITLGLSNEQNKHLTYQIWKKYREKYFEIAENACQQAAETLANLMQNSEFKKHPLPDHFLKTSETAEINFEWLALFDSYMLEYDSQHR